jgi:2-polyprenyl-6-hydroxyphenyl methylase / 3-demethylubiquinone-9 3-methyltransferase
MLDFGNIHRRRMARAQRRSRKVAPVPRSSVDVREVEKFSALAGEWWDPDGSFAALHRLNPLRLAFVRRVSVRHFGRDELKLRPFAGLSLVDVGCGGGLLAEPLARQGFDVLGIDASRENIAAASTHARATKPAPAYRFARAEDLAQERLSFDAAVAMEILEHVADRDDFLQTCASLVKPGGLLVLATINRTFKSLALAKFGAEYVLRWIPPGTHDWNRFVTPQELSKSIQKAGLCVLDTQGVSFDPFGWCWRLSSDTEVNYMLAASKPIATPPSRGRSRIATL